MKLTHEIPSEFENEERWLKFFTLKSLIACLLTAGVGIILFKLLSPIKLGIIGIVIGVILTIAMYIITMLKTNSFGVSNYLKGSGQPIENFLVNLYYRRKHSYIYVLGFGDNQDDLHGPVKNSRTF